MPQLLPSVLVAVVGPALELPRLYLAKINVKSSLFLMEELVQLEDLK